jgi:hypothetical protein
MATAAVGASVAVVPTSDPPPKATTAEFDGRTWLHTPAGYLLVNGISGAIEASAPSTQPVGMTVAGSAARRTALLDATRATAVVIDDRSHQVTAVDTRAAAAVQTSAGALVLGDPSVFVPAEDAASPTILPDLVATQADAIVDSSGLTWALVGNDSGRSLLTINDVGVIVGTRPATASDVLLVDGRAFVRLADGVSPVDGGDTLPANPDDLLPTVVESSGGLWSTASGATVTTRRGATRTELTAPADVASLAIWHGTTWFATASDVVRITDASTQAVPIAGAAAAYVDGGRLWFVGDTRAMSIDRAQRVTVFDIATADLSLCVETCAATDAIEFNEDQADQSTTTTTVADTPPLGATTTAPAITTTSTIASALTLPPALPTTTAPSTTQPTATTRAPATPSTSSATSTSIRTGPSTSAAPQASSTTAPAPSTSPATSTTVAPAPTTTPPTTPPPPPVGGGSLVLGVVSASPLRPGPIVVRIGFRGSRTQCSVNGGPIGSGVADARITVTGSAARTVGVRLAASGNSGGTADETVEVQGGTSTITLTMCGLTTATTIDVVPSASPSLGSISSSGIAAVGSTITFAASLTTPSGWTTSSAVWSFGRCGAEQPITGTIGNGSTSANAAPQTVGEHCAQVAVTFTNGTLTQQANQQSSIDVADSTTSTSTTTSTTVQGATTTSSTTTTTTTTTTTIPTTTSTTTTTTTTSTTTTSTTTTTTTTEPPPTT